jgi:hypothetical protein
MENIILDEIEFNISPAQVMKKLRVKKGSRYEGLIHQMVDQALQIGRPKAIYTVAGVEERYESGVIVNGIRLESKVMAVNLADVHRVFPYITTCGRELYDWKTSIDDMLENFYADEISQMALRSAERFLLTHLKETYALGKTATMNPGSIEDWPITAQRSLFSLLGNQHGSIGVELLDSMLMVPNQTTSGIRFVSEEGFSSCELCPRDCCTHRRAPYDPELVREKYRGSKQETQ